MDLKEERHHLEHVWKKLCTREPKRRRRRNVSHHRGLGALRRHVEINSGTLDVVLKNLCDDGKECFLEAADRGGVGLAGDPDGQAQGLKQVVVKVRLAGILKMGDQELRGHIQHPEQTRILGNLSV